MPERDLLFENSAIELGHLPDIESSQFIPIDRRYAKILYISNTIAFGIILIFLLLFIFLYLGILHWLSYASLLLWMLLLLASFWFASTSVDRKSYFLRQRDISFKTGVFFRDWITVPFTRVQHCELSRGILDRSFGLAELRVYTAGGSSSDISIPGLKDDIAIKLKDFVISKIRDLDEEE